MPDGEDLRADHRSHVFLMAVLVTGTASYPVRVRNISAHGALLEARNLPQEKQMVSLRRGSLAVTGQIAWLSDRHCGIRFTNGINVDEWVDRAGPIDQQRIDAAVAEYQNNAITKGSIAIPAEHLNQDGLLEVSERLLRISERIAELPGMSIELGEEVLKIEAAAHELYEMARPKG